MPTTPDFSTDRLVADFVKGRSFVGGAQAGAPASLVAGPRLTPRGLVTEPTATDLMTNSRMLIDPFTGKPFGWSATSGAVLDILEQGVDNDGEQDIPWTRVRLTFANPGDVTNVRLSLEENNGLEFGVAPGPFAGRVYSFGTVITVESITNASLVSVRLTGRDAGGNLVGVDGSDGRTIVSNIGIPTDVLAIPDFDPTARFMQPVITMLAGAFLTASMTLKIGDLQLIAGRARIRFIGTSPPTALPNNAYPNPTLAGASVSPNTRPAGWLVGGGITTTMLAVSPGVVDVQVNIAAGALGTLRLSPLAGVSAGIAAIPAAAGQQWVGNVEATILANPSNIVAAIDVRARSAGGSLLDNSTATVLVSGQRKQSGVLDCPADTANVNNEISFTGLPVGVATSITLRIREPRTERLVPVPGSGPVTRQGDAPTWVNPSTYAMPFSEVIEAEHRSVDQPQTLATYVFGATRLRMLTGQRIGAVWETLSAGVWSPVSEISKPALYPAGRYKLSLSMRRDGGSVIASIGYPDEADGGSAEASIVLAGSTQPSAVFLGWSGDPSAPLTADTAIRRISVKALPISAENLRARSQRNWLPRFFAQPVAYEPGMGIYDVPAFTIPKTVIVGDAFTYVEIPDNLATPDENERVTYRNRYVLRTNAANGNMSDTLVNPPGSGASANTPAVVVLINGNTAGVLTVTTPSGSINDIGTATVTAASNGATLPGATAIYVTTVTGYATSGTLTINGVSVGYAGTASDAPGGGPRFIGLSGGPGTLATGMRVLGPRAVNPASYDIPAGMYGVCATNGKRYWIELRPVAGLEDPNTYLIMRFPSIYGRQDPINNPSRSVIDLEYYTRSQAVVSPIRQQGSYLTRTMNLWAGKRDKIEAAKCARCLYEWRDYWRPDPILTDVTADPELRREAGNAANTLPTQVISNVGAYVGIRDAGVLTPQQDAAIRVKIAAWAEDLLEYDGARKEEGLARRAAGDQLTGLQNHFYSYGYAIGLCAVALDRADLYDECFDAFKIAIEDMQAVPGHVGCFPNELVRGAKSMIYQNLATLCLVGIAMILRLHGVDTLNYAGGALRQIVNFTATAVLESTPTSVQAEMTRMAGLGLTGLNGDIIPQLQEKLNTNAGSDQEGYPGESKSAWVWLMYRLMSTAEAPWRPGWKVIIDLFENCYSTSMNGELRASLYPLLLVPE
ncbi:alginate lyase family protein [Nevskia ramosa]|uniref:alginate lyase family protein n=1 Tax=Nevskia ramosa TaxID=64002 RepID=UPI003D0F5AC1